MITRRAVMAALLATSFSRSLFASDPVSAPVRTRRKYIPLKNGKQLHLHIAQPAVSSLIRRRPLICFHPTAYSGKFFREYQNLMAADRVVICPDTPGYGNSDKPDTTPTINEYAQAMCEVVDQLAATSRDGVDLLGFHTGCFIATEVAILRPRTVNKLILPGIPYEQGEARLAALEENAKQAPYFSDVNALGEKWLNQWEWQGSAVTMPRLLELLAEEIAAGPDNWWAYQAVFSYAVEEKLPQVQQPVLALATDGDLFEATTAAAELMPDASVGSYPELDAPLFNKHQHTLADLSRQFLDAPPKEKLPEDAQESLAEEPSATL